MISEPIANFFRTAQTPFLLIPLNGNKLDCPKETTEVVEREGAKKGTFPLETLDI